MVKVNLNPTALTLGDLEDFAATTGGHDITAVIADLGDGRLDLITHSDHVSLVWVFGRHRDPRFTRDQARALRPDQVEYVAVGAEDD